MGNSVTFLFFSKSIQSCCYDLMQSIPDIYVARFLPVLNNKFLINFFLF